MDILVNALILAGVFGIAVVSPGPDLVMAVRNSLSYGRLIGFWTALGFGLSIVIHVTYTSLGLAVLISQSVIAFTLIKAIGACYLIYMGIKALRSNGMKTLHVNGQPSKQSISAFKALTQGFITNLLNPKATLFFLALFSQFIRPEDPAWIYIVYGSVCFSLVVIWFSLVSIFLTVPSVRNKFLMISKWVDRVCGTLFIALGVKLAITEAPN